MGLPKIIIDFKTAGTTAISRSSRGHVAIVLSGQESDTHFSSITEVDKDQYSDEVYQTIALCFSGGANKVSLVYNNPMALMRAFGYVEGGWVCTLAGNENELVTYVKEDRAKGGYARAVVATDTAPDCEGIVWIESGSFGIDFGEYMTLENKYYTARIAGILAGLSLGRSATYFPLPELQDYPISTDPDTDIEAGKLVVVMNNMKVRLGRAVTSFVSTTPEKGEQFKKIKIVEAVDLMRKDISETFEKSYIGKAINDYDNKMLLVTAINGYFAALEGEVLDSSYENRAFVDVEAQRVWLMSNGIDTEGMSDADIARANTGSEVFLGANVKFTDAMEDLTFSVNM